MSAATDASCLADAPLRRRMCRVRRAGVGHPPLVYGDGEEVPEYLRADAPFILGGHRRETRSWAAAARTAFALHNETVNIWTHLLGSAAFAGLAAAFTLAWRLEGGTEHRPPRWPLALTLWCFATVLAVSAACHTLCCVGPAVYRAAWRLDRTAVAVSLASTFVPFVWYAFPCEGGAAPRAVYLGVEGLLCAASVLHALLGRGGVGGSGARLVLFAAQGAWGVAPLAHAVALHWRVESGARAGILFAMATAALNALGIAVFAARVPERLRPGAFDIWGASHQLFHVIILAAFAAYARGGLLLWRWRALGGAACPPAA